MNHSLRQLLQNSLINDKPQYKDIVSEDQLDQLKIYNFRNDECDYNSCPISMKTFEEGEEITKLECGHIFDTASIKKWVTIEKASCPVCRFKLKCKQVRISRDGDSQESELANTSNNESAAGEDISNPSGMVVDNSYNIIYNTIVREVRSMGQNEQQTAINILTEYISRNNNTGGSGSSGSVSTSIENTINRSYINMENYRRTYGINSYVTENDIALQQAIIESMGEN